MNPREYFYSTAKNSPTSKTAHYPSPPQPHRPHLPIPRPLRRGNSRLLHCHFLMYHPLAHIKDEARCRIFSAVLRLSHCLVTHSPPSPHQPPTHPRLHPLPHLSPPPPPSPALIILY